MSKNKDTEFGPGMKPEKKMVEKSKFKAKPLSRSKTELTRFKLPNFNVFN